MSGEVNSTSVYVQHVEGLSSDADKRTRTGLIKLKLPFPESNKISYATTVDTKRESYFRKLPLVNFFEKKNSLH